MPAASCPQVPRTAGNGPSPRGRYTCALTVKPGRLSNRIFSIRKKRRSIVPLQRALSGVFRGRGAKARAIARRTSSWYCRACAQRRPAFGIRSAQSLHVVVVHHVLVTCARHASFRSNDVMMRVCGQSIERSKRCLNCPTLVRTCSGESCPYFNE